MEFKSKTAPLCRWCGRPIPKKTTTFYCSTPGEYTSADYEYNKTLKLAKRPTTKAECQRLTNFTVVSVRKYYGGAEIAKFTAWDGESYESEFFCTNDCAIRLGNSAAKYNGVATEQWRAAMKTAGAKNG